MEPHRDVTVRKTNNSPGCRREYFDLSGYFSVAKGTGHLIELTSRLAR